MVLSVIWNLADWFILILSFIHSKISASTYCLVEISADLKKLRLLWDIQTSINYNESQNTKWEIMTVKMWSRALRKVCIECCGHIGSEQKLSLKSGFILQSVNPWHLFREAIFSLSMHSLYHNMIIWIMTHKLGEGSFGGCCVHCWILSAFLA